MPFSRLIAPANALAAGFALVAVDDANAAAGGSNSFGSRGTQTYAAPPATYTAPKAAPIEKSMTQKGAPTVATSARCFVGCDECEPGRQSNGADAATFALWWMAREASAVKRENGVVTPSTSWPEEDLQTVVRMLDPYCHEVL